MFRDFGRRLQRDIKRSVDARLKLSEQLSGGRIKVIQSIYFISTNFLPYCNLFWTCVTLIRVCHPRMQPKCCDCVTPSLHLSHHRCHAYVIMKRLGISKATGVQNLQCDEFQFTSHIASCTGRHTTPWCNDIHQRLIDRTATEQHNCILLSLLSCNQLEFAYVFTIYKLQFSIYCQLLLS